MEKTSNLQRAFWTFLGYMLVGPFFGALAIALILGGAPFFGLGELLPTDLPPVGAATVTVFIWSVMPSAVAAIIAVPFVLRCGRFSWIGAAVAGIAGFALIAILTEIPFRDLFAQLAFLAGLVSLAVRQALVAGSILEN